jgi:D-sedoheptulose 7-phosphate isomerase
MLPIEVVVCKNITSLILYFGKYLMREFARSYLSKLISDYESIEASDFEGKSLSVYEGIEKVVQTIISQSLTGQKIIFIGNGASAAISSHMATDYWKNGGVRSLAFNDSSLLTCISNDYGFKHVFEKPIEMFADEGDILIAISSSGKSENILRGVQAARSAKCRVVTLSGFKTDNPLRAIGDFNFYVPSSSYGSVEIIHLSICHCICDAIIQEKSKPSTK